MEQLQNLPEFRKICFDTTLKERNMNILKLFPAIFLFLVLAGTTAAQDSAGPGKCPPYDDPDMTFDANPIVDAIDLNGDDKMTHDEWMAAEAPEPSWNMFMGKKKIKDQGYITRKDFIKETPPNGIDTNCDGFITIDEFLATKKWKMGPPPGDMDKNRPAISAGERALAMLEVQNTFSKHAFYHQVGKHCEEMDDIWVREDGKYGKTATWRTMGNVYEGIPLLREYYCAVNLENQKRSLETLSRKIPEVKNIPENLGAGHEYVMHTQETPVIEVAGDGKTAKGIWYSIGLAVRGSVDADKKTSVTTGWMWEKYAVDFAKEDGKWKIWHLMNIMDQGPVEPGALGPGPGGPPPGGPPPAVQGQPDRFVEAGERTENTMPQPTRPDPNPPRTWSPMTAPGIQPPFPEPYYTFSETFSY